MDDEVSVRGAGTSSMPASKAKNPSVASDNVRIENEAAKWFVKGGRKMLCAADDTDTDIAQPPLIAADQGGGSAASIPPLDVHRYRSELEGLALTEDQQAELLRTLYFIMATFVDWGFGVDSVQRLFPALADFSSTPDSNALEETGSAGHAPVKATKKGSPDD